MRPSQLLRVPKIREAHLAGNYKNTNSSTENRQIDKTMRAHSCSIHGYSIVESCFFFFGRREEGELNENEKRYEQ